MANLSRPLAVGSLLLAAFVAVREIIYYIDHPQRSGPSFAIALLATAVALGAVAALGKKQP